MKLLLTSSGLRNKSIISTLLELCGKPFSETTFAFIPTAADVESDDKEWLVRDISNAWKLKFKLFDIVDISAIGRELWLPRLEASDVLMFGGGNTFHLMYWLEKSGLDKLLPEMLKTKVYVGISAGSMVSGKNILISDAKRLYYEDLGGEYKQSFSSNKESGGLGFVNFHIRPHFNSPHFPNVNEDTLRELAKDIAEPIYALDDETALKVVDGDVEIISEGKHAEFNLNG